jgi:carboxypeptidase family protein
MRLRPIRLLFSSSLLVVCLVNSLTSQTTTSGGLAGVITDPSSAVVPDASVEIKDSSKGTIQATKTDRAGVYRFFFLAPGKYRLTVAHDGFREESRAVNVLLGPPVSVNVPLAVAKASSEITVTDEAPLINAENGDVSATVNQTQISEVPNPGNDLTYVAQVAPGAVMNTDSWNNPNSAGNFSILGMPGTSYRYTVDGMNANDPSGTVSMGGSLGLTLGQNQIQEATVVSTGYSSQFGGAAGGNINFITKSGTNEFHGNSQYYWNGRPFNANDWINKAFGVPRPFSIANQWAGSFGGPIKKNKLFLFLDTEGLRLLIPQTFAVTIPSPEFEAATIANIDSRFGPTSASDAFYKRMFDLYNTTPGASGAIPGGFSAADPLGCTGFSGPNGLGTTVPCALHFVKTRARPSQDALISGRVDWNLSKNDRAFLRAQGEQGVAAFYTDAISSLFDADYTVSTWQGQLVETHTFGSKAASQFLVAGSEQDFVWKARNLSQALAAFPTTLNFASFTFQGLGGVDWIGASGCNCIQYQVSEDALTTWGSHKLGVGASFAQTHWNAPPNNVNATGQLSPQTLRAFYQGGMDPATPSADFTLLTQSFNSRSAVHVSFLNFGFYGQDEWHARSNLTVSLGLRAEHYSNPACEDGCFARLAGPFESINHDPNQPYNQAILINREHALLSTDSILWSPRFSFAWQPFGVARSGVLRGGVGFFYNPMTDPNLEPFYLNPPTYNVYTPFADNLTPSENTSLFKDAAVSNATFVHGFAAGETLAQIQTTDPNFRPPAVNASERMMHQPQYQRWSLEWQQDFGGNTSGSIGYYGHHGIREMVVEPSANAFGFGSLPAGPCSSPPVAPCSDPRFSEVTRYATDAVSNYNGMVVSVRHRFTRWSNGLIEINYTYGHAFDEVSNGGLFSFTQGSSIYPQDPNNLRGAYGPAEYDIRHSMNADYVWELPVKSALGGHGPDSLLKGWQLSGTIFARTGFPYTVFDNLESGNLRQNNYFGQIYSVPVSPLSAGSSCGAGAAIPLALYPCQPPEVFANGNTNPNALFVQTGCETGFNTGNLPGPSGSCNGPAVSFSQGRNRFRGPGYFNTDLAIMKNTKIPGWEKGMLGIGFQFFNLFNHPNFGFPDNYSSSPTFGQIFYLEQPPTSVLGSGLGGDASPRMIQLKVQLQF